MPTLDALPYLILCYVHQMRHLHHLLHKRDKKLGTKKTQKKYQAITYSLDTTFLDISAVSRNTTSSILKTC